MVIVDIAAVDRQKAIEAIARLEKELFGRGAWNAHMVQEELAAPARTYVLAVNDIADSCVSAGEAYAAASVSSGMEDADHVSGTDPKILGYAGFWYDGDDAELMTIGVDESYQRRGIAAGLLARLIELAKRQGASRMLLEVRVDNGPALALYRRFGFSRMGLRKRYYQPEGIDAYTMSLDLAPRVVGFIPGNAKAGPNDARSAGESLNPGSGSAIPESKERQGENQ